MCADLECVEEATVPMGEMVDLLVDPFPMVLVCPTCIVAVDRCLRLSGPPMTCFFEVCRLGAFEITSLLEEVVLAP